jgi:hypothetical protein
VMVERVRRVSGRVMIVGVGMLRWVGGECRKECRGRRMLGAGRATMSHIDSQACQPTLVNC